MTMSTGHRHGRGGQHSSYTQQQPPRRGSHCSRRGTDPYLRNNDKVFEAQTWCPSSTKFGTSPSETALPTCAPEAGTVCFATKKFNNPAISLGGVITECPLSSSTTNYTVPGTNLKFRGVCEADYPADDTGKFPVTTMLDCIHLCAQLNLYPASAMGRCMGVSWLYADGLQGKRIGLCYPKSEMVKSHARIATESAVLVIE
ncbi:hypothetical protein VTI74DRAFT_7265 [Chaetomium olivicolor]